MATSHKEIDTLLRRQDFSPRHDDCETVYRYAQCVASIENSIVVVSDLKEGCSKIFHGRFSKNIGLSGIESESSIWESEVLDHIPTDDLDNKFVAELRFYNFLRRLPRLRREDYYLSTKLRMADRSGRPIDIRHRMYYRYQPDSDTVRFGICIYEPAPPGMALKSYAVDAVGGDIVELAADADKAILSAREKQVLSLVEQGYTSSDIATRLSISKHTVSRHRQEILAKLMAGNSAEACRRARQLRILE
ncbi:MAG: helix-turn-helix transcriptional regulator [Muribaculaceae bacterium]|nr:helix-turn-helix transcriptional regulator [Muribaculaceae bacterium]